jgi:HK97 family phage major capsid protein
MTAFLKATTGQSCEGLSLGRLVAAAHRGDWKGADAEKRVMGTFPNVVGGFMVPEVISGSVIDLVRNQSVLSTAGAITIPISSNNITLVRVLTDPTAAWRSEGQTIAESDANFDATQITPNSLAVLCRVNAELLDDVPSFASTLDGILAASLAVKLDYTGLYGTGVGPQPLGLRNALGVTEGTMGTNGATPTTYDNILDLLYAVQAQNGTPNTLIWAPRTVNTYAKIVTGIASDKTKLAPPPDVVALRKLASNQVSIAETQGSSGVASTIFVGGFENVGLVMRQTLQIESSRVSGTAFERNQVLVRAILRADVAKLRPQLVGRLIGVLA